MPIKTLREIVDVDISHVSMGADPQAVFPDWFGSKVIGPIIGGSDAMAIGAIATLDQMSSSNDYSIQNYRCYYYDQFLDTTIIKDISNIALAPLPNAYESVSCKYGFGCFEGKDIIAGIYIGFKNPGYDVGIFRVEDGAIVFNQVQIDMAGVENLHGGVQMDLYLDNGTTDAFVIVRTGVDTSDFYTISTTGFSVSPAEALNAGINFNSVSFISVSGGSPYIVYGEGGQLWQYTGAAEAYDFQTPNGEILLLDGDYGGIANTPVTIKNSTIIPAYLDGEYGLIVEYEFENFDFYRIGTENYPMMFADGIQDGPPPWTLRNIFCGKYPA